MAGLTELGKTIPSDTLWFPSEEGPDLSTELMPGQHDALRALANSSVAAMFSPDFNDGADNSAEEPDTVDPLADTSL